ncbi:MAG: type VI secretion system protein ImpC [Halieaceae bacterium]|jgi:type VI secretion system protein ImpC
MSRPSISTGGILFKSKTPTAPRQRPPEDQPMHILFVGDFSGRGSRGESDPAGLATRRIAEIDRDNFDEVFSKLKVRLQLPFGDEPIAFDEIDELHPDILLEQVHLFAEFRNLQRQLKNPSSFGEAAERIRSWSQAAEAAPDTSSSEDKNSGADPRESIPMPEDLFDSVLSQSHDSSTGSAGSASNISRLIQGIVSPYVEAGEDPDLPTYQKALGDAMSEALRKIMHAGDFQNLEANWLSLYLLVRRLETDSTLKLFVLDASREELLADCGTAEQIEDTALYQRLVSAQQVPGATPFALINYDLILRDDVEDLRLAAAISKIGEQAHSLVICSASGRLAGCDDLGHQEDISDWNYAVDEDIAAGWQAVRQEASARSLIACAPRFLARLPYGKSTSPIETFAFEELGPEHEHEFYCWAPGAYLLTLAIAQGFLKAGWQSRLTEVNHIDELPLHVYSDKDGESCIKPCAETYMRDSVADALAAVGISSLRSVKRQEAVLIPVMRSVHVSGSVASWAEHA